MRIGIINAQVDKPLFIKGTNLGDKPGLNRAVAMQYDIEWQCLIVSYRGGIALIPQGSVKSMELLNPFDLNPLPVGETQSPLNQNEPQGFKGIGFESPAHQSAQPISAQVETPTQPKAGNAGRGENSRKSAA